MADHSPPPSSAAPSGPSGPLGGFGFPISGPAATLGALPASVPYYPYLLAAGLAVLFLFWHQPLSSSSTSKFPHYRKL
ncbi:hypothetical protein MYCTH_2312927 [Thermothelomyces thermophilus ATCC 42464]|uniref:Uncharacterized protein n=1 Tax=Thermothelomyces thermophilus (strain ATCC 42464 / BCRC 31852 / DSM 1799) TaxID=573729 RepID=G2QNF4_THET4|nr:uncharacterized protein MYCTH_2312927 [Thermothelomyces thermophilus ATCC 42464]AEO62027.1 hypothetical protein MYCTH_2312927 [Thermothelomyces thermophilus ATCC 42464]